MNNIVKGVSRLLAVALATGGVALAGEKDSKVAETKSQVIENKVEAEEEQTANESKKCRMKITKTTNVDGKQETVEYEINDPEVVDKTVKEMKLNEYLGGAFKGFSGFDRYDSLNGFTLDDFMFGGFGLGNRIWNAWFNSFLSDSRKKQNDVDSKDKVGESTEDKENKSSDEEKAENNKDAFTAKPLDISKDNEKK